MQMGGRPVSDGEALRNAGETHRAIGSATVARSGLLCWTGPQCAQVDPAETCVLLNGLFSDDETARRTNSNGDGCLRPTFNEWLERLNSDVTQFCRRQKLLLPKLALWPRGSVFAACLTHDVDHLHDRELFGLLADANHLRRMMFEAESGSVSKCLSRMRRAVMRPKDPMREFKAILTLERRRGWRSTFYLLDDRYWARYGSRYRLNDPRLRRITDALRAEGCELGVHGSYYAFADEKWFCSAAERFERVFGFRPAGVRNHYLRFALPETWRAQARAGFAYDATVGSNTTVGPCGGLALPFFGFDPQANASLDILELPLTIMDATLFGHLKLDPVAAFDLGCKIVGEIRAHRGLATLLWHPNYFDEPEFEDWECVYSSMLDLLAREGALVLPAAEIAHWWRARAGAKFLTIGWGPNWWTGSLEVSEAIEGLAVEIETGPTTDTVSVKGAPAEVERGVGRIQIRFQRLTPKDRVLISVGKINS